MANIHILARAASDNGVFTGGSWQTTLPLSNLKTQQPTQVARSTNALVASTKFVVDMQRIAPVSMFAMVGHNFSVAAIVRLRVSEDASGASPTLDVTLPAVEPAVVWGSQPWGAFPWDGLEPDQLSSTVSFYKHPAPVLGRYILVDIDDTSNSNGYVQLGRFMAGDAFVPRWNMAYGASFAFVDESRLSRSVGGQLYADPKPKRRRFSCAFEALYEPEAWGAAYDMQRGLGKTGNMLIVYNPDDHESVVKRRTIYGTMVSLDEIVTANPSDAPYNWRLSVEELV